MVNGERKPLSDDLKIGGIEDWEQLFQMMDDVQRWKDWEEVPDEVLWEDGEISNNTCMIKIYNNVVADGKWKLIRRKNE